MTRGRTIALAVLVVFAVGGAAGVVLYKRIPWLNRADRQSPEDIRLEVAALESERLRLRQRLEDLVIRDPRLSAMPDTPVRVAVPTALVGELVQRIVMGLVDNVRLELGPFRMERSGTVRRVVTLGTYDLDATITRVTGSISTRAPKLAFGGNRVGLTLPLAVSGAWRATMNFTWDGRNVGGLVCGDMTVTQPVTGTVKPITYPLAGTLSLSSTANEILITPRVPPIRLHLDVVPAPAAWQAVQQILDSKRGLCGYVIDRVDIMGLLKRLVDKGVDVRVPTNRLHAFALPVRVEPTMEVRGKPVSLGVRVGDLAITEYALWLGAYVKIAGLDGESAPVRLLTR